MIDSLLVQRILEHDEKLIESLSCSDCKGSCRQTAIFGYSSTTCSEQIQKIIKSFYTEFILQMILVVAWQRRIKNYEGFGKPLTIAYHY